MEKEIEILRKQVEELTKRVKILEERRERREHLPTTRVRGY